MCHAQMVDPASLRPEHMVFETSRGAEMRARAFPERPKVALVLSRMSAIRAAPR